MTDALTSLERQYDECFEGELRMLARRREQDKDLTIETLEMTLNVLYEIDGNNWEGRSAVVQRALDAGATGFMVKDAPVEALADGVRTVAAGGRAIDQSLALEALSAGSSPLTDREADVLRGVDVDV